MKAIVLAAGFGKRLQPLTKAIPKPMVPVANKPILQYNIELLKKYGVKDVIVNIHYFPEQLENYFGEGSNYGINLRYSYEEILMGTAGGVRRMCQQLKVNDTFIVISADILTDINIGNFLAFHKKKRSIATLALTPVNDVTQFGVAVQDSNGRITSFQEKPSKEDALSNMVNAGMYIFEPQILDLIPENIEYDFGMQVFPEMVKKNIPLYGYKMIEYWNDIGGPEKLMEANADILQGRVRAAVAAKKYAESTWLGKNTQIDRSAKFDGEIIIGDNSIIGRNVEIYGNVAIGDKCVIEDGAIISNAFVWGDTHIGKNVRLNKCIVGNWCRIEDDVKVEEGSIISNRCIVKQGKRISSNSHIDPDKTI